VNEPEAPADYLRRELKRLGMSQTDLAFVLGVPQPNVSALVNGRRGLSATMARALSLVLDAEPEHILGLQKTFELHQELARADEPDLGIGRRAHLVRTYPIREMAKRGWIGNHRDTLEEDVATFFEVDSVDAAPRMAHAARKTGVGIPAAQLAWLYRAKQLAETMVSPAYTPAKLQRAIDEELPPLRITPEEARRVPRILDECGVRFLVVQGLPGSKIDGACFWLDGGSTPVVALSMRFDRIDNFWFVLRHELEHVLRRDGVDLPLEAVAVDANLDGTEEAEAEKIANAAAADFCVPKRKMDSFVARKGPRFSTRDVLGFARVQGVHPGLVAGQVRQRTSNYRIFSKMLVKIRHVIVQTAVADGWGDIAPLF